MMNHSKTWVIVLFVLGLHGLGIVWFNDGFFLTRLELANKSECNEAPHLGRKQHDDGQCWARSRFKRAIVVVIDALRYDFAAWDFGKDDDEPLKPFENKMPAIRDLILNRPLNSFLVPFYADPPTTTMQRLKGMVTGGFPTFMEIKDDVASEGIEITEDNFIDLLINDGKRNITFMGDDTWTVLFPSQFNRAFPYPSFNVKDLHTVDDGVLEHLVPEMKRDDWSFLVAHFLGVDHCGHRFGPENDAMRSKLLQMNQAIEDIVFTMDQGGFDDTVLLVFGDHGMTSDGNHGGATDLEVGAALFVYSPKPILLGGDKPFARNDTKQHMEARAVLMEELRVLHPEHYSSSSTFNANMQASHWLLHRRVSVQQIDLAPTLALLLGLPIPFGSMGAIVPELFFVGVSYDSDPLTWIQRYEELNHAMQVNCGQVLRYLRTYSQKLGKGKAAYLGLSEEALDEMESLIREAFHELGKVDRNDLAQLRIAHQRTYNVSKKVLSDASAQGRALWTQFDLYNMGFGISTVFLGIVVLIWKMPVVENHALDEVAIVVVALLMQLLGRLSNSYIVAEPRVNTFVGVSLFAFVLVRSCQKGWTKCVGPALLGMICTRLSVELAVIQWWRGQEVLSNDVHEAWIWGLCFIPLGLILLFVSHCYRRFLPENMTPLYIFDVQAIGTGLHWLWQGQSDAFKEEHAEFRLLFPRIVYGLALLGFLSSHKIQNVYVWCLPLFCPFLLLIGPCSPTTMLLFLVQIASTVYIARLRVFSLLLVSMLWSVTSMTYFFATGHESFFNKLHYASPFVGFDEYEYFRGAIMMGFNTFGIYIVMSLLIPGLLSSSLTSSPVAKVREIEYLVFTFMASQALRTIVMVGFVAMERRHLMVWAIFAPKYVFDAVTMLVVDVSCLVVCLFIRAS